MDNEEQEKPKLTRAELLAKARQIKKEKSLAKQNVINDDLLIRKINNLDVDDITPPAPENFKKKKEPKEPKEPKIKVVKPKQEIKEFEMTNKKQEREPEIIEEVVRVPGNRHKKIVKRTIEIEESETDEEIIEEIVKIPKMKKDIKISRDEMKKKLAENNKQRLYSELFS